MQLELYWHPSTKPGVRFDFPLGSQARSRGTLLLRVPGHYRQPDYILCDGHRTEDIVEAHSDDAPYARVFMVTIPPAALVGIERSAAENAC